MTKELIIGTTNQAKISQIRSALLPLNLEIIGLPNGNLPKIDENGQTAQENAKIKAIEYSKLLDKTVLSMDNALYFNNLDEKDQPGIYVRRINGGNSDRPTDKELIQYYSKLISKLGKQTNGRWEFAVCIAKPSEELFETTIISPRIFTSVVSPKTVEGFPLESIQIDPETGKYISEMTQEEQDLFWQKTIGKELQEFVKSSLL